MKDGINNQNLMLFIRGKAMSTAHNIKGTIQLPKPPIMTGITMKKIMIKACPVTRTLYMWSSPSKEPLLLNSKRIINLIEDPIIPHQLPKSK